MSSGCPTITLDAPATKTVTYLGFKMSKLNCTKTIIMTDVLHSFVGGSSCRTQCPFSWTSYIVLNISWWMGRVCTIGLYRTDSSFEWRTRFSTKYRLRLRNVDQFAKKKLCQRNRRCLQEREKYLNILSDGAKICNTLLKWFRSLQVTHFVKIDMDAY